MKVTLTKLLSITLVLTIISNVDRFNLGENIFTKLLQDAPKAKKKIATFKDLGNTATWIDLNPAGFDRIEGQTAVVDGKYYVFTGFNRYEDANGDGQSELLITASSEVYDPSTETWTGIAAIPFPVSHADVVVFGKEVWFPGGFIGNDPGVSTNKVQIYNTVTDTWRAGPALPEAMASHGVARLGNRIHVFGGLKTDRKTDNDAHYFLDLDNQALGWQKAATFPLPRNHMSAISVKGKIYAIGGQYNHDDLSKVKDLPFVHAYDPVTNTWQQVSNLQQRRSHFEPGTFATPDGKIIIVGGRSQFGSNPQKTAMNEITEYDPDTDTWSQLEGMPKKLLAPGAELIDGILYVSHGGPGFSKPRRELRKVSFVRPELKELGFSTPTIDIEIEQGESISQKAFLYTIAQKTNFNISLTNPANWLNLSHNEGIVSPKSFELDLNINTQDLSTGDYQTTLNATASGFKSAQLNINLRVIPAKSAKPRVLYIYGDVDEFGFLRHDIKFYNNTAYHQMRLTDTGNLGMSSFREAIQELGLDIEELYDQDIVLEADFLNKFDVIILSSNQKVWSDAEVAALNTWVRAGGGLIAYSDSGFGGAWFNPAPAGLNNEQGRNSNNILTEQFGMFFFTDQGGSGGNNLVSEWKIDHFLNTKNNVPQSLKFEGEGCSPVRIDPDWPQKQSNDQVYQIAAFQNGGRGGPTTIKDPQFGNTDIFNPDTDCALAAAEIGEGRVIGTFDRNTFWNNGPGTDLFREDNRLFAQKLLQWVAKKPMLEVPIQGELKKWHQITLTFDGPQTHEEAAINPFTDYKLDVVFTKGNRSFKRPGFYAADGNAAETGASSGNKWQVHFVPDRVGVWHYKVTFRVAENIAVSDDLYEGIANYFDGLEGSFEVGESDKTGPDFRSKGFLQYADAHYLRFQNGDWFLKAGVGSPETLLAYEDFDNTYTYDQSGNLENTIKSWQAHLNDWQSGDPTWQGGKGKGLIGAINYLADRGNNSLSFLTYNSGGDGKNVWPFIAHNNRLRYDCSKLAQWEIVFNHANQKGIHLSLVTQETENDNEPEWSLDLGTLSLQRKCYYRELIARFGHLLALTWNLGEENSQTTRQRQKMAQYFEAHDKFNHPIVLHSFADVPRQNEAFEPLLGNESQLNGASLQIDPYDQTHQITLDWIKKSLNANRKWVVTNDEQGPYQTAVPPDEGWQGFSAQSLGLGGPTQDDIRKYVLWGNLMAQGAGVEYTFASIFPENDLTAQDWRSRENMWNYNQYALQFFYQNNIPFWEMSNQDALVSEVESAYCLTKGEELYVVYLPQGGAPRLNLGGTSDTQYEIFWYNPREGGILQTGERISVSGAKSAFLGNPPLDTEQDWVVIAQASIAEPPNDNTQDTTDNDAEDNPIVISLEPTLPKPLPTSYQLNIFPNPSHRFVNVQYANDEYQPERVYVEVINPQGQRILRQDLNPDTQGWQVQLDLQNQARGHYFLIVYDGVGQSRYQFILQ